MKKNKKKLLGLLGSILVCTMLLTSVTYASYGTKMIEASFRNIQIVVNNRIIQSDKEPFIVDGTTYVPLRMLSDILGKDVTFESQTSTITLADKTDPQVEQLQAQLQRQLIQSFQQTSELKQKIAELEAQLEGEEETSDIANTGSDKMFEEFAKELNDDYGEYEDIEFDIWLEGDEYDITVAIEFDSDEFETEWRRLNSTEIRDFIEDIFDDVKREYRHADIEGYIKDFDRRSELVEFETLSSGNLRIRYYDYVMDLDDLEDRLNGYYDDYNNIAFDIDLDGDEDDIDVEIEADLERYDDEWDDMSRSDKREFIEYIFEDILKVFKNADIEGNIYDTDAGERVLTFEMDSDGDPDIDYTP